MELELYLADAKDDMEKAIQNYESNLVKISASRANPKIFENIKVLYYGEYTPLSQVCAFSIPEARQIIVKPFDPTIMKEVVSAINATHIGLLAVNEGDKARITIPELTSERRKELIKQTVKYTEEAKIAIRLARQRVNKDIKDDEELPEDDEHHYLEEIQKLTDKFNQRVSEMSEIKAQELSTI